MHTRWRRAAVAGAGICAAALLATGLLSVSAMASESSLVASVDGDGDACTLAEPCAMTTAFAAAQPGDTILLQAGDYGTQVVHGRGGTANDLIHVRPADRGQVTFGRLTTHVPNAQWSDVRATVTFYLSPDARGSVIDGVHLDGAGMFVRSSNTVVRNSVMEGGHSIDGIQIGRASDVLIEGNTIHNYDQEGDSGYHADCIQVFDADRITIRRNSMRSCYDAGLIFSSGGGQGLSHIVVESNFIEGCPEKSETCRGGSAVNLREPSAHDVIVRNNTIVNGSAQVSPLSGLVFDRNIIGWLSQCDSPATNSIIEHWNLGLCATPKALEGDFGNREGRAALVDRAGGDLHIADVSTATVSPKGGEPASEDFDGAPIPPTIAGASSGEEPSKSGGSPGLSPSPSPSPSQPGTDDEATPSPTDDPTVLPTPAEAAGRSSRSTVDHAQVNRYFPRGRGLAPRTLELLANDHADEVWIQYGKVKITAHRIGPDRWAVQVPASWIRRLRDGRIDVAQVTDDGWVSVTSGYSPTWER